MRLPFRKKEKKGGSLTGPLPDEFRPNGAFTPPLFPPSRYSARLLAQLPPRVIERIFVFVCPHTRDESYEPCEESANERGCMLCDLRDLSNCAKVSRAWRSSAVRTLYHSVRIDPVHYCRLEAFLAERRKKTSRFDRNGIPEDPALARLRLLRRTVRDDPTRIGKLIEFLKTPYMIRESCHVELAQTIAVLPNLKYVDLPEGMFSDEPAYATLRLEVQARCPNIRKTTFLGGSERSFAMLASGQIWPYLEVLELNNLKVDPKVLRGVLASLPNLRALKVTDTYSLSDEVLAADENLPPLPALEEIVLKDTPGLTSAGLVDYLSWYETQKALRVLTLKDTGIQPWRLQEVLSMAPALKTVAVQSKVNEPFPGSAAGGNEPVPQLSHKRLRTLRYEISASSKAGPYATQAYYSYLSGSILSGGLPRLRRLYVLDDEFPDQLANLPPPNATFAGGRVRSASSGSANSTAPTLRVSPPSVRQPTSPGRQNFPTAMSPTRQNFSSAMSPTRQNFPNVAGNRLSSNNPFAPKEVSSAGPTQTLEVFTKSDEFGKWNFARVDSFTTRGSSSATARPQRPTSSYGLAADVAGQGWDRGEARRSVMIGNGTGGFLPVPGAEGDGGMPFSLGPVPVPASDPLRPKSSGGASARRGMWR